MKSLSPTAELILEDIGFGDIPSGWQIVRIEDLLASERPISVGVMYPGEHVADGVPLIKAGDLNGNSINSAPAYRISNEKHHEYRRTELSGGELLISLVGDVGRCAVVPSRMTGWNVARAVAVLRFKDPGDADYVRFCLLSSPMQHLMNAWATTTVQATLNLKEIRQLPLPWPSDIERRAISSVLSALDDKIELSRRMNATLEGMARVIFQSWFVDFDPVRAKAEGRETGLPAEIAALFPNECDEQSLLGAIPRGWQVNSLDNVLCDLETGGRPKGGVADFTSGIPSIGAESIVGLGIFDYSKTKYVPQEYFRNMKKGHVRSRDVLLYKDGGRPGQFEPHLSLFGDGFPFVTCAINEHVYRIRARHEYGQNYLYYWLSSDLVMAEMRVKGTGVAIPGLNSTQVKSLSFLDPGSTLASTFDFHVEPLIARILANSVEARTLQLLRDALLPKLISGQLPVSEADELIEEAIS